MNSQRESFSKWLENQIWTCDRQPTTRDIDYMWAAWQAAMVQSGELGYSVESDLIETQKALSVAETKIEEYEGFFTGEDGESHGGDAKALINQYLAAHPPKPTGGDLIRFDFTNADGQPDCKIITHDEMRDRYADMARSNAMQATGGGVPEGLVEFANRMLAASRDGCGVDGVDIQDWALECGLIEPYQATESCGEDCVCAEVSDFPVECYRNTALLATQQPPEQE